MKIIAQPIGLPSEQEITKENIATTPLGKKIFAIIEEGIEKNFLKYKNIDACLKKFQSQVLFGTCEGQSSAVIIADHLAPKNDGKQLVKKASKLDALCYQLLMDLASTVGLSIGAKKELKKIEVKIKDASKHHAKKLKKEKKELQLGFQMVEQILAMPIKTIKTKKLDQAKEFEKKIGALSRSMLEEQSGYTWSAKKTIRSNKKQTFTKLIKKIQKEENDTALKVSFMFHSDIGHAVTLFPTHRLAYYDANQGLMQASSKKDFVKSVEKLYERYYPHHKKGEIVVDIFKQK